MKKKCEYCEIPKRELNTTDYFNQMILWRQYVKDGNLKFKGGDSSLENFEEEISKEEKYVYYHYFECICGNYIKSGVSIRSSVPILEHIDKLPLEYKN
jgi:hypothetical protein